MARHDRGYSPGLMLVPGSDEALGKCGSNTAIFAALYLHQNAENRGPK
jgi:hypothetical protein